MSNNQPETMGDLLGEFEFTVEGVQPDVPTQGITVDMGDDTSEPKGGEEEASKEGKKKESLEESKKKEELEDQKSKGNGKDESEKEGAKPKKEEEDESNKEELEAAAAEAKKGDNSGYKTLALKYIEKGTWSDNLAILDEEGNEVLISEMDEIDEDTFFQIEEAVKAQEKEDNKDKFLSIEGIDERRKNLIEIVKEGGDLTQIFSSPEQVEEYINPFSKFDLEDERVQERIYLNALMKHNQLDEDTAKTVVAKAKKDLTLDTKVKTYVDQYTESFDKYVEDKKAQIVAEKKEEVKKAREFKKTLKEKYKSFDIKDTLASKLADSAVNKKDGEFEIDSVYASKMEDPDEAAEIILFLTDKKAYLDYKMKDKNLENQKKTRQLISIVPKSNVKSKSETKEEEEDDEFSFKVKTN